MAQANLGYGLCSRQTCAMDYGPDKPVLWTMVQTNLGYGLWSRQTWAIEYAQANLTYGLWLRQTWAILDYGSDKSRKNWNVAQTNFGKTGL